MSFSFNSEYKYVYKPDFNPNILMLTKTYLPIIDKNAFCLYSLMCEEHKNFVTTSFFKNKFLEFQKILNISEEELLHARQTLEAFGLLKTSLSDTNKIYFELFEPLKFDDFEKNVLYFHNLENKMGKDYSSKIKSQYQENKICETFKDISVDPEIYFNDNDYAQKTGFDFAKLYETITKTSSIPVTISMDVKNTINFYFKNHNLSDAEIEQCVYKSIIKNKGNFEVDNFLIEQELSNVANKDFGNFGKMFKLNRSKKMFLEKLEIDELVSIFNTYKNFKPEQFLSFITHEKASKQEIKIIDNLKNNYGLPECIINLMIDYSIGKTHNELNESYLSKMAKSFSVHQLDELQDVYDFLMSPNNKKNKNVSKRVEQKQEISSFDDSYSLFDVEDKPKNVERKNIEISQINENDEEIDLSFLGNI